MKLLWSLPFLTFLFSITLIADDVYLKNGQVIKNCQVQDTINNKVKIVTTLKGNGERIIVINSIFRIVVTPFNPQKETEIVELESQVISDTSSTNTLKSSLTFPWSNSVYVSLGYGLPQGMRSEIGYFFGNNLSLGFTLGVGDQWSGESTLATIGGLLQFRFNRIANSSITPCILFCYGARPTIFGEYPDKYIIFYGGAIIQLSQWLVWRTEMGLVSTSKRTSSGIDLFGGYTSKVYENETYLGINISLELELKAIL
jgi:hypothetical protein